jgi:hypothetical protein
MACIGRRFTRNPGLRCVTPYFYLGLRARSNEY